MRFGLGQFTLQIPPWDSRTPAQLYDDTLDLAAYAEQRGFSSFWLAEHHAAQDSYNPSLLPFLAAVAARTTTMQLGTGVLLAPLHHPLRLAEDAAVVANLSNGRLVLGLGLGWVEDEYRMFGVPMRNRGRRLAEIVDVLRLAWSGERFTYRGKELTFEDVAVTPRPPGARVPIFLGGGADAAIDRAVAMGDGHFPASVVGAGEVGLHAQRIAKMRRDRGYDGPYRYGCFMPVGFGEDEASGWASIRDGVMHVRGAYLTWLQGKRELAEAKEAVAAMEPQIRAGSVCGSPSQVLERLKPVVEQILDSGLDDPFVSVILAPPGTPLETAKQRVDTFAETVIAKLA